MKREDFYFELPQAFIAQYPLEKRSDSRLLTYHRASDTYEHHQFKSLPNFLEPGDLLVMNDSKVIPARLYGRKISGGKVECLIERLVDDTGFLAHVKGGKTLQSGSEILLKQGWSFKIIERVGELFFCKANGNASEMLEAVGHVPLPPYIDRQDELSDKTRYQTIYARHEGSVAAPTAGLHFDTPVLNALKAKGVNLGYTTLHVGAGTFRPLRCDVIYDHNMHCEYFTVDETLCDLVRHTKALGKKVIAVGTTALRSLESSAENGELVPCSRDTDLFIYPGFQFQICDGLITNFHLPESTLLMLVSAFIGYDEMKKLYQAAIDQQYRFFSYGDACLLL